MMSPVSLTSDTSVIARLKRGREEEEENLGLNEANMMSLEKENIKEVSTSNGSEGDEEDKQAEGRCLKRPRLMDSG